MKEKEIKNEELEVKASEETQQEAEVKEEVKEEEQAPVEEPKEVKDENPPAPKKVGVLEKIGSGAKKAAGWIIGGALVVGGAILYGSSKYNEGRADQAALDLKAQQKGQEALPDNNSNEAEVIEDAEFHEIETSDEQSEE